MKSIKIGIRMFVSDVRHGGPDARQFAKVQNSENLRDWGGWVRFQHRCKGFKFLCFVILTKRFGFRG